MVENNESILFVATNGVGLGHLTRALGVAKQIKKIAPSIEIVFLVTSLAARVVYEQGFKCYYIPSRENLPTHISADDWNEMLIKRLKEILKKHLPVALVFDGAYPYQGLIWMFEQYPRMKTFWIKREGGKEDSPKLKSKENSFHHIIVPEEIIGTYKEEKNKFYCAPIIMLQEDELLEREKAREVLGIPLDKKVYYVQLGAGLINNIKDDITIIIEYLLEQKDNFIILAESIIGEPLEIIHSNMKVLRDYPNAIYYRACDFAISAAGYNTFHELIYFGIPTIFIPNTHTVKDDQVARAQKAEQLHVGVCLLEVNKIRFGEALEKLKEIDRMFLQNSRRESFHNGTEEAAKYIINAL